jgi:hypothetical protein
VLLAHALHGLENLDLLLLDTTRADDKAPATRGERATGA